MDMTGCDLELVARLWLADLEQVATRLWLAGERDCPSFLFLLVARPRRQGGGTLKAPAPLLPQLSKCGGRGGGGGQARQDLQRGPHTDTWVVLAHPLLPPAATTATQLLFLEQEVVVGWRRLPLFSVPMFPAARKFTASGTAAFLFSSGGGGSCATDGGDDQRGFYVIVVVVILVILVFLFLAGFFV